MFFEIVIIVLVTAFIFLLFFSVAAIVNYLVQRHELGQEGAKRKLLSGIPGICAALVAGLILAVLLITVVPKGWGEQVATYLRVFVLYIIPIGVSAILWIPIVTWPWRKKKAGMVLVDIGPLKSKGGIFVILLIFIFSGFLALVNAMRGIGDIIHSVSLITLLLTVAFSSLLHGRLINVRITERGISTFLFLLKWKWIIAYEWIGKEKYVLSLQFKKYVSLFRAPSRWRSFMLRIPLDRKDSVDKLLDKYLMHMNL